MVEPRYRRVIVKIGGEALSGPDGFGVHQPAVDRVAADLQRDQVVFFVVGQVGVGVAVCLDLLHLQRIRVRRRGTDFGRVAAHADRRDDVGLRDPRIGDPWGADRIGQSVD